MANTLLPWHFDKLLLVILSIYLLIKYLSRNYDYWKRRGIFYIEPVPLFGNFYDIVTFKMSIGEYLAKLYRMTDEPFFGIFVFSTPHLILKSPELIKHILIKDFHCFSDRTIFAGDYEPMSKHMLFLSKNPEWKKTRNKMTPVFSTGKLKGMMPLITGVNEDMKKYIRRVALSNDFVNAKEIAAKYSTDIIAICAFAINAKSFENEDAEFRRMGKLVFDFRWVTGIQQTSLFFLPTLAEIFHMKFIDPVVTDFMREAFWKAIEIREKSGVKRHDVIDAIIDIRKNKDISDDFEFEGDKVVSQAAQFFTAGFESASSTMSFTLYELCLQPEIQNRLRKELREALKEYGEFSYDCVRNLKYLHMCASETLRKYPVVPFLDRRCMMDYKIPGTEIVIEKGTPVYIPMIGLHNDPEFFPHPEKYDPERFSDQNLKNLVSGSYIPFGEGPRTCIGERFGLMATKLGLAHVISEFEVSRTPETPVPIAFEPKQFLLASKVGLPMKFRLAP